MIIIIVTAGIFMVRGFMVIDGGDIVSDRHVGSNVGAVVMDSWLMIDYLLCSVVVGRFSVVSFVVRHFVMDDMCAFLVHWHVDVLTVMVFFLIRSVS